MKEIIQAELARIKLEMKDWETVHFYYMKETWKRLNNEQQILQKVLDMENTATENK